MSLLDLEPVLSLLGSPERVLEKELNLKGLDLRLSALIAVVLYTIPGLFMVVRQSPRRHRALRSRRRPAVARTRGCRGRRLHDARPSVAHIGSAQLCAAGLQSARAGASGSGGRKRAAGRGAGLPRRRPPAHLPLSVRWAARSAAARPPPARRSCSRRVSGRACPKRATAARWRSSASLTA